MLRSRVNVGDAPHPPAYLDGARVLYFADVGGLRSSGRTAHLIDGEPVGRFARLAVAQYEGKPQTYLFLCDDNWQVLTDMLFRNPEQCLEYARAEYPGIEFGSGEALQGDPPATGEPDPLMAEAGARLKDGHSPDQLAQFLADRGCGYMEIVTALRDVAGLSFFDANQAARKVSG